MTHKEGTSAGKWPKMEYEEQQVLTLETILGIWAPGRNGHVDPRLFFGSDRSNIKEWYGMGSHTS